MSEEIKSDGWSISELRGERSEGDKFVHPGTTVEVRGQGSEVRGQNSGGREEHGRGTVSGTQNEISLFKHKPTLHETQEKRRN